MRIIVTGATGFVGARLVAELSTQHEVVALRRRAAAAASTGVTWRECDLYSLAQTEAAVRDADVGVYLVHSMMPAARLTQASFEDTDLLLADNFARACALGGVRRIVYLGGLIPDSAVLSPHLESRREVESALAAYGAQVVTLRAGLLIGAEGSSFQMLASLVRRLPVLVCPRWTRSLTQPVAARDAIALLRYAATTSTLPPGHYDIGMDEPTTYQALMEAVAQASGLKRSFIPVPFFSPGLSQGWVQLITGASGQLVRPLLQSLQHAMVTHDRRLAEQAGHVMQRLEPALEEAIEGWRPTLRTDTGQRRRALRSGSEVRSIQRLPLPAGRDALWVADEYFRWLPRFLAPALQVKQARDGAWEFRLRFLPKPLLRLQPAPERSSPSRALFFIIGGMLARTTPQETPGRLEFRVMLDGSCVLAAIQGFRPRLPWLVYKYTQAVFHLFVMRAFGRHLKRSTDDSDQRRTLLVD